MPDDPTALELSNQIAGEIFAEDPPPEGGDQNTPPEPQPQGEQTPPLVQAVQQTLPQEIPMPKAWKKEKEALWKTLSPEVREYIQTREADVVKGFDQYSNGHNNWSKLLQPYEPVLKQHPNVDPVQLLQNLMNNHLRLLQTPAEERKSLAFNLLKQYGIEFDTSTGAQSQTPAPPAIPPEIQRALSKVGSLEQGFMTLQQTIQQQQVAEQAKIVAAFAADPKHEYFEEVGDDILRLLKTGAADSLESAYETAIWANPVTRQKLLAKQALEAKPPPKAPKNVDGSGEGTPRGQKPPTMDDTINAVIAKHYGTQTH